LFFQCDCGCRIEKIFVPRGDKNQQNAPHRGNLWFPLLTLKLTICRRQIDAEAALSNATIGSIVAASAHPLLIGFLFAMQSIAKSYKSVIGLYKPEA